MPVIWQPTRDALRARALATGGAVRTMATDLANRLDVAGEPYDRRLPDPKVTASRVAWSAAYRLAHEQADDAARIVTPGAPLPFDDLTPPTAVAARARAAVAPAPNPTTKALLEQLASAVEGAWRSTPGLWGTPETESASGWLGTADEKQAYEQARYDALSNSENASRLGQGLEAHAAIGRMSQAAARKNAIADAIAARLKLKGYNERSPMSEQVYYRERVEDSLYRSANIVKSPPMLDLEHALLLTLIEAADFLAAS